MTSETTQGIDIKAWCADVLHDSGGSMDNYEEREFVAWGVPERGATAHWIIRCLANPACEGSRAVLDSIEQQRALKGESR